MYRVSTAPACHISLTRLVCRVVECWNKQIWSRFPTINVRVVHAPTDDCCVWIGCVDVIFDDLLTEYRAWSFDPWWKNRVGCSRCVCKLHWFYNPQTALMNRTWGVHMTKFGRISLLEITYSAYLSPCDLYFVFECVGLKNSYAPTEI